jgi:two-component system OmpR family sensor kinase
MASLRARLLVAVLALAAAGLLLVGGITYFEQRSYQMERVDEQTRAAVGPVARELHEQGFGPERGPPRGGPEKGGGPGGGPPNGTYGQRRDASGNVLADVTLSLGTTTTTTPEPDLPADLPPGRLTTVSTDNGDYRVLASPDPEGGGTTVVAVPLREVDQALDRLLLVEALVIGGVLVVLGVVAWVVVRVGLLPLDRIGHTAGAIAGGDLSHRVEHTDPRTEVGRVGIALNAMLDRLETAFAEREASQERLRQFIADASHELRTPLASIRGYAEVFRMGAARDPADVERAMRRIEDEAARMGVLVEDLLTLARLGEVPETPYTAVDLARLARDSIADARVTAPDRRFEVAADEPATVQGDAHQLRQVLGNLLRNAIVHTPDGTPVEVSVRRADGHVRLEVRDHGPGLPKGNTAALFERFWRAAGGRERGRGGTGLGLAIVAAIVDAHGGVVSAEDAPGGGASFVVRLPTGSASANAQDPPTLP